MRPCGTTVDVQFHPDNIPSHSNVCTLNFDSRRYWDAGPPFTDVPFPGHTLPIQEWLVNSLTRAPQLVCVRSRAAEDLYKNSFKTKNNAGYTGLCLTTFTNGRNALVHAWQDVQCIEHSGVSGYETWWKGMYKPDRMEEYLTQASAMLLCPNSASSGESAALQGLNHEQGWLNGGIVDMTDYEGRPVPCWLLTEVYKQTSHPRFWTNGQRDLRLPAGVRETLSKWKADEDVNTQSA